MIVQGVVWGSGIRVYNGMVDILNQKWRAMDNFQKVDIKTLLSCGYDNSNINLLYKCKYAKFDFCNHQFKCTWKHPCPFKGDDRNPEDTIPVLSQKLKQKA